MSVLMRRENTLIIEPGSDISKIQIINFILLPNSKKHFEGPPLYFKIDLDESGRLNLPIVTKFDQDGYIGIYFDKQLIKDGKAKQLFKNATYKNLLILDKQNFVLKEEWNIK
ncbi:Conserved_hypothetical protein [Hexamita inflata]|uniref:Uncharacterized protein n=1 Tax=Hexamita inflata TaxID=28002 RepID=A0AA86U266_9EUKA|nr:Conserved hypothetical protein [Hexamita inflata]